MKIVLPLLILISSVSSYAELKNKMRWPAQESPLISRNIIQCDFASNNLEIASIEIFASTTTKGSQIVLSNISSIASIAAHGSFKVLSSGGALVISESMDITGKITLAGNTATLSYIKGIGTLNLNGTEIKASGCTSVLK